MWSTATWPWASALFGAPCVVIELSGNPFGGLTRVALPFMSLSGLRPQEDVHSTTHSALGSGRNRNEPVEPMLESIGVVVWH